MIKKFAVVAAAASALVLADASWAVAGSGGHGGTDRRGGDVGIACVVGQDAGFSNNCGNTYIYKPNLLGDLLNLLSPPPTTGGGGNNGGGNNGGGNNGGGNNGGGTGNNGGGSSGGNS
ncbi:hypothetical protein ACFVX9_01160 [Kitasatospora sp. NPDC058243]|uniref:hypothetical protein n=1 Tax=Kitasatospora sp. NPDC058243 TaxID=3346397 RepID=UPI0036D91AFF